MGRKGIARICLNIGIIAAVLIGHSSALLAQSAQDRRLVETSVFEPGFEPVSVAFSDDETNLYVSGNSDQGQIIRLDMAGDVQESQVFEGVISQVLIGADALFVIGTSEDATLVEMRDLKSLELATRQKLPFIGQPKGHLGNSGKLYIGGYTPGTYDNATLFVLDATRAGFPVLEDQQRDLLFNGSIGRFWVSEDETRIFVNDAEFGRLWSITSEGHLETSIGHNAQKNEDAVAFSIAASAKNDPRCLELLKLTPNEPSRFIISDYILASVKSAEFSLSFGVFDIISETGLRLNNPNNARLETYDETGVIRPPMLVSASCDQSTILISNRYSDQVVQYTHRVGSNAFELVNKWAVRPGQEVAVVSTSDQGKWGAVALKDVGTVVLLSADPGVAKEQAPDAELLNRAIQRELLFVGYRIGAIDGILGGKTSAAMEAFAKQHNFDVDLSNPRLFFEEMQKVSGSKAPE